MVQLSLPIEGAGDFMMLHDARWRAVSATLLLLAVAGLAGCSNTTDGHGSAAQPTPATSGAPSDTGSAPSAPSTEDSTSGALSKAEVITQADAVCKQVDTARAALPTPSSLTDYDAIVKNLQGTLVLFPQYFSQVSAVVARSADVAELTAKWTALEASDFAASKPFLDELLAAAQARDSTAVDAASNKLDSATDHSDEIAAFLRSYGLTDCATLVSS